MVFQNFLNVLPAYGVFFLFVMILSLFWLWRKPDAPLSMILSISATLSVIFYTLMFFFLRLVGVSTKMSIIAIWSIIIILILIFVVFVYLKIKSGRQLPVESLKKIYQRRAVFLYVVLLIYFVILSSFLFRNGYDSDGNLKMTTMFSTEVMWHLTIIQGIEYDILPQTLHFNQTDVANYHFFPNLFIYAVAQLIGSKEYFLLFVYFFVPLLLIIFSVHLYGLTLLLWGRYWVSFLTVVTFLFCYDLSAPILWLRAIVTEGNFWFGSNPPVMASVWTPVISFFQLFYNPSYLFSSAMFFGVVVIFVRAIRSKKYFWYLILALAIVFLFKAKITAFFVALAGLLFWTAYQFILKKNYLSLLLLLLILAGSYPFYAISKAQKKNQPEWSHWYFPANFAERSGFINKAERQYLYDHSYLTSASGIARFSLAIVVYYIGLFHVRLLGLLLMFHWRKARSWIEENSIHVFLIGSTIGGLFAFIFIVNALSKYDSHWFYSLIIFVVNIYFVKGLVDWFMSKSLVTRSASILLAVLFMTTIGSFVVPVLKIQDNDLQAIPKEEVEGYLFLRNLPSERYVITRYFDWLTPDDEKHQFIMALTGKKVVSEGVQYVFEYRAKDSLYFERHKQIRYDVSQFYNTTVEFEALQIMERYNIGYVFLKNPDKLHFSYEKNFEEVFSNSAIKILKRRTNA